MEHTFIRDGIGVSGQVAMEDALRQQKSLWKYVGIFTNVPLVFAIQLMPLVSFSTKE